MNIQMINSIGGFDRLFIDGSVYTMPSSGITLRQNFNFIECINNDSRIYEQSIAKLKINIIGEIKDTAETIEENIEYKEKLERNGIRGVTIGRYSRYCIGYINILIIKKDSQFISEESYTSKSEEAFERIAKKADEASLLIASLRLANQIVNTKKNDCDDASIAMIDKIFIHKLFRNQGIATWIHQNLYDIIQAYTMFNINAITLYYANFTNEKEENYLEKLHNHYIKNGYSDFNKLIRLREGLDAKNIMYRLNNVRI